MNTGRKAISRISELAQLNEERAIRTAIGTRGRIPSLGHQYDYSNSPGS